MSTFIAIILSAVLTDNFITKQTYGICPFLGVSKKTSGALGMGIAVTVVMALATLVTYPLYIYVMKPLGFAFLEIIFFIFVIASLVQMLEKIIQKGSISYGKDRKLHHRPCPASARHLCIPTGQSRRRNRHHL